MIYSQQRFFVRCDKCGKTIETNATDCKTAKETAERKGWKVSIRDRNPLLVFDYVCYCPKCKEEEI